MKSVWKTWVVFREKIHRVPVNCSRIWASNTKEANGEHCSCNRMLCTFRYLQIQAKPKRHGIYIFDAQSRFPPKTKWTSSMKATISKLLPVVFLRIQCISFQKLAKETKINFAWKHWPSCFQIENSNLIFLSSFFEPVCFNPATSCSTIVSLLKYVIQLNFCCSALPRETIVIRSSMIFV